MAVIGTAGHIDHGKTALVKALTGVDTDRLPEEKARGITIDLGFAHANWNGVDVSFIDVPGHERFVRNMLAGIGGIDLLMLVIAADESVMPQTREHFDICRLLNIPSGIIVITKSDLVDQQTLDLARAEISDLVKDSFLENALTYVVSAITGAGVEELRSGILQHLNSIESRNTNGIFRLPVDRIFTLKGHGTVVTGTLISGSIRKEQTIEILPSGLRTKVRSLHAHNQAVDQAMAGQRTSVNVQSIEKEQIIRGDLLTEPDVLKPTSLLDVKLTLLNDVKPLAHNSLVRFHYLATDTLARITLLGLETLQPGGTTYAQLRLQKPVSALYGDRFILRRQTPLITVGGGIILDHLPMKRINRGDAQAQKRLQEFENGNDSDRLKVIVEQKGIHGADEKYLKARMGLHPRNILELVSDAILILKQRPLLMISASAAKTFLEKIRATVESFHHKNPLLPGFPKEELRSRLVPNISPEIYQALLDHAVTSGIIQLQKDAVTLVGQKPQLSGEDEAMSELLEKKVFETGIEFPGISELATKIQKKPENVTKILYLLIRQGKVVKVADDFFMHRKTVDEIKSKIRGLKAVQKTFSVADFKTRFGVSRKYAIPLLELLDREGVTRRMGNERIII
ncbi:selenocysteine-specific translation elongation factor [bacterium]|nr:selenocysteine-specific translation elongation factor [bacterium]